MTPENFTFILASNRGGETRRVSISKAWLKAGSYLAFVGFLLLVTGLVDYTGLLSKADEHQRLLVENLELKENTASLERRLSSVTLELERVHKMTTKLKVITNLGLELTGAEDLPAPAPAPTPTVSPGLVTGAVAESEDVGDARGPASIAGSETFRGMADQLLTASVAPETLTLPERIELTLQDSRLREQELMTTWGALSDRQSMLAAMPSIRPANGYYSSPFGYRFDPINGRPLLHAGVDIAAPWGTQVLAPGDGVVSYVGFEGGYGNLVAIDHGYGVTTRFAHNSRIFVRQGQRVRRWEPISAVGSTGHSTGAHVHYEVRVHGLPVDPMNYILQEN